MDSMSLRYEGVVFDTADRRETEVSDTVENQRQFVTETGIPTEKFLPFARKRIEELQGVHPPRIDSLHVFTDRP